MLMFKILENIWVENIQIRIRQKFNGDNILKILILIKLLIDSFSEKIMKSSFSNNDIILIVHFALLTPTDS